MWRNLKVQLYPYFLGAIVAVCFVNLIAPMAYAGGTGLEQISFIAKIMDFLASKEVILGAVYVLVEYFLGQTTLVKSGSVLEMALGFIKKIIDIVRPKKSGLSS